MSVLAGAKALQVRHSADESIGKPRTSQRNLGPFRLSLRPNPQFVRFAARVVKKEPELGVRRALSPIETELGRLMFATEGVVVIDRHRRTDLVSHSQELPSCGSGPCRKPDGRSSSRARL